MRKLLNSFLGFFPEEAESYSDCIEIHPVKEYEDGSCTVVEEGEENFWSVFFHQLIGRLQCKAYVYIKLEAEKLVSLIKNAVNYHVYSKSF